MEGSIDLGEVIWGSLTTILLSILAAVAGAVKAFRFVQEGERGIKLRFGRSVRDKNNIPKVIEPGFVVLVPWVESLKCRHVRQQTIQLSDQRISLKDDLVYIVSAMLLYRVKDVYKALFEIDDLDSSLEDLARGILREILSDKDHKTIKDASSISTELLEKIKKSGDEWGVEFLEFKLVDNAPTAEAARLLQLEAGADIKLDVLRRTAEAMKIPLEGLNNGLGALLVGAPLVASASTVSQNITNDYSQSFNLREKKEEE